MTSLGQVLIENGLVSERQVDEALRRQEQLGGRLGTCLLELGAITERQLDAALTTQLEIPAAGVDDLRGVPEEIHSLLPANLAISCEAIPFRVRDDRVDIAILEIKNRGLHDELAFVIGKWIHVHIANEVRIFEALQSYYGRDCTPRYRTLLDRLDQGQDGTPESDAPARAFQPEVETERVEVVPEAEDGPEPHVEVEAETEPPVEIEAEVNTEAEAEVAADSPEDGAIEDLVNHPFPDLEGGPAPAPLEDTPADARGPKLVYPPSPMRERSIQLTAAQRDALRRKEEAETTENALAASSSPLAPTEVEPAATEVPAATSRDPATVELQPKATVEPHPSAPWKAESVDQIGQNLLRELGRQFRRVALYRIGREGVRGWMGKGEALDSARLASYRGELAQGSVFDSLASGGHLYVGRLTRSVAHDELLAAIGASPNTECMLTAITVGGRVVALTYGDSGSDGLGETDLAAVQQLATRAGEAMRDLILRRKRKQA